MTKPHGIADDLAVIRRLIVASLAIIVVIGAIFYTSSRGTDSELRAQNARLKATVDQIVKTRVEGRITTCASDQRFELAHNRLVQGNKDFISKLLGDAAATKPAAERPAILSYAVDRGAEFELTKAPVRGCTPAAIAAFYRNAPPAVPCTHGADNKGYCTP